MMRQSGVRILYDDAAAPQFDPAWFDRGSLVRSGAVERETGGGRAPAVFFAAAGDDFVFKHYRRGGWPGRFIREVYFYAGEAMVRSFREWRLLAKLRELSLPVPVPCAARYRRRGTLYTADLITFRCGGTKPLSEVLTRGRLSADGWRTIGAVLRRFDGAGVCHADLNAHNVLLDERFVARDDSRGGEPVFLVDFDKAKIGGGMESSLRRLRRSLAKLRSQSPAFAYKDENFLELLAGYQREQFLIK